MANVCLLPDKTKTIDANQPTSTNPCLYDAVGVMYAGSTKTFRFRLLATWTIPAEILSAEILSAEVRFRILSNYGGGSVPGSTCRVTQAWTTGGTWNTYDGTNAWPVNGTGGDYVDWTAGEGGPIDFTTNVDSFNWWTFDVTNVVKAAIASYGRLFDILLKLDTENPGVDTGYSIDELASPSLTAFRPMLVIVRPPFGMPMEV